MLYVDDLLIAAPTKSVIFDIRDQLLAHFKLKHLGEVKTFLGFDIVRNREERRVFVSQARYTKSLIQKFGYDDLHGVNTPWPQDIKVGDHKTGDELLEQQKWYIKKTGSLNYLSMGTRPDITFTVNEFCLQGECKPDNWLNDSYEAPLSIFVKNYGYGYSSGRKALTTGHGFEGIRRCFLC